MKPDSLGLGLGVHKVSSVGKDPTDLFKELLAEKTENNKVTWTSSSCLVLEEPIRQSENLSLLHPNSVNMVRLTTIRNDGKTGFVDAWLRVVNEWNGDCSSIVW